MKYFLLTWNPEESSVTTASLSWDDIQGKDFKDLKFSSNWSIGRIKKPRAGDRFFFVRVNEEPKGIFAGGEILSEKPYEAASWKNPQKKANYIDIQIDTFSKNLLTIDFLNSHPNLRGYVKNKPDKVHTNKWTPESSGTEIYPQYIPALESEWAKVCLRETGVYHIYYAKKCLSLLIARIKNARSLDELPITYGELSENIGYPITAAAANHFSGNIGDTLYAIKKIILQENIPYLQTLVVGKGTGMPGKGFENLVKGYDEWEPQKQKDFTTREYEAIINFGNENWDRLLADCDLPNFTAIRTLTPVDAKQQEFEINFPEEIIDKKGNITEGAKKQITINSYERNPKARAQCINHYGAKCHVCDFDFESTYGIIGKNYIHVHHIKELSIVDGSYDVDPINDLIPVCPNCHAMLHKKKPAYTVSELKGRLR